MVSGTGNDLVLSGKESLRESRTGHTGENGLFYPKAAAAPGALLVIFENMTPFYELRTIVLVIFVTNIIVGVIRVHP
jgi:hypothetical protein